VDADIARKSIAAIANVAIKIDSACDEVRSCSECFAVHSTSVLILSTPSPTNTLSAACRQSRVCWASWISTLTTSRRRLALSPRWEHSYSPVIIMPCPGPDSVVRIMRCFLLCRICFASTLSGTRKSFPRCRRHLRLLTRRTARCANVRLPNDAQVHSLQLCCLSVQVAVIWMIGEYGETIKDAPYILEPLIDGFAEETSRAVSEQ